MGRINGRSRLGSDAVPIHFLYRSVPEEELTALYAAADVMLVTPLRDGMNLVAKEYVASRTPPRHRPFALSELTGAALGAGVEALAVNPYDVEGLSQRIEDALRPPGGHPPRRAGRDGAARPRP